MVSVAEPNGLRESPRDEQGPDHMGTMVCFFNPHPRTCLQRGRKGKREKERNFGCPPPPKCPDRLGITGDRTRNPMP